MTKPVAAQYSLAKIKSELDHRQALSDYADKLVGWEETEAAFTAAVDTVSRSVAELAALAAKVDAKRLSMLAQHNELRGKGAHAEPPRVRSGSARMILEAARRNRGSAIAAIGQAAKARRLGSEN
jgi:hypothetical protein